MFSKEFKFLLKIFFLWLGALAAILFFAVKFVPVQETFLGGGYSNYLNNPYFWSLGNFDGEHYVSIAKFGYGFGQYSFFPLYPLLIITVGEIFGTNQLILNSAGISISLVAFFVSLVGFFKLLRLDFSEKFSKTAIILLLLFPTSFYFAGVYTESLFFALLVWSFYFARKGNFFLASILGIFLTATRFVGILIFPGILAEWILQRGSRKEIFKDFPESILGIPIGLFSYMYFLEKKTHDMFAFYNNLAKFGEQRSTHPIFLPQVFYRYIFKILPSLKTDFFPILFSTGLEFFVGILYLTFSVIAFFKIRISYALVLFLGYLIPTFSGSFSSLPRYVLVLFPAYILFALGLSKSRIYLFVFMVLSFILLVISFSLFARGYWIS